MQEGDLLWKNGMAKKKPLLEYWAQKNCGSRKRVTITDRKLARYTGMVWLKEKLRKHYEDRKGLEDLGGGLPLCPRNEKTSSWTYRKTIDRMKIAKQKAGSFATSRKIEDWTLWRNRPTSKQKEKRKTKQQQQQKR
jgi:hypothetical protein